MRTGGTTIFEPPRRMYRRATGRLALMLDSPPPKTSGPKQDTFLYGSHHLCQTSCQTLCQTWPLFVVFFGEFFKFERKEPDHEPCPDMNALIVNWIFSSTWKLNLRDNHCLMVSIPTFYLFEDPFLPVNIHIPSGCWNLHHLLTFAKNTILWLRSFGQKPGNCIHG